MGDQQKINEGSEGDGVGKEDLNQGKQNFIVIND
jgi:hypothetical protein